MLSTLLELVTSLPASALTSSGAVSGYAILATSLLTCVVALRSDSSNAHNQLEGTSVDDTEPLLAALED